MKQRISAVAPSTQKTIKVYQAATEADIIEAKHKAESAAEKWGDLSVSRRVKYLTKLRQVIVKDLEEIIEQITLDTGKVDVEAVMSDIIPTLEIIKYYEENAADILAPQKRDTPLIFLGNESYLEYSPLGVVAIIAPWNYPFQLALVPIISALAAGNAVLLKPSEVTPLVGELIDRICQRANLPVNLVQILQGGVEVGEQLIAAQPDKVFFTGSGATGKKILKQAAENLIPVELELGGKDPMLVFKDADLDRAVEGAVYGAFANSGQLCVGVERLYVEEEIYKEFVKATTARAKEVTVGSGVEADLGAITYRQQLETIEEHLADARQKGAEVLTQIKKDGRYLHPVVLTNVDHEMKVMTEETFGPVLPIMPFTGEKEAVQLANDTKYGLNSSVWSKDLEKAKRVVSKLKVGNSYINDVVKNIANPDLPFGGAKQSGLGEYHGPTGLYSFSQVTSVMVNTSGREREINWFPFSQDTLATLKKLIHTNYGKLKWWKKIKNLLTLFRKLK